MFDFNYKLDKNNYIIVEPAGLVHASNQIIMPVIKELHEKKIECKLLSGNSIFGQQQGLKVSAEHVVELLSVLNQECIKRSYQMILQDKYSIFHIKRSGLDTLDYLRVNKLLESQQHPLANKLIAPREIKYRDVFEKGIESWIKIANLNQNKNKYSNDWTEVEFLLDCILNLKTDIQGRFYCTPSDCLAYKKYYDKDQDNHDIFIKEMVQLLQAIDPALELEQVNLHENFCFTQKASTKLLELMTQIDKEFVGDFKQENKELSISDNNLINSENTSLFSKLNIN
ncbi:MAG: hypothetical protein HYX60_07600 [Legionella longbeachae]|nr:hypothetical protein [Legionella longbeachae]